MEQIVIIGAGPCGLSAALELQKQGWDPLVIEKECIVHSIYLYPTNIQFFSTPELLEIGDIPFTTPNDKPTRLEALNYYRNVALRSSLRIRSYHTVTALSKNPGEEGFKLTVESRSGQVEEISSRYVVVATGYFDQPNLLGIPGEELPKVSHYFREAHPYTGTRVVIIGGSNSAIDAAMELHRAGAEVTVVYRGSSHSSNIKPWVLPIFTSMVNKERISMRLESRVTAIHEDRVTISSAHGAEEELPNDFVLALTGFRPDRTLLRDCGAEVGAADAVPVYDPATMESTVPGLYIAGVAASGTNANEVFIETGRFHGRLIASHLADAQPGV